jgi:hypothetical protein
LTTDDAIGDSKRRRKEKFILEISISRYIAIVHHTIFDLMEDIEVLFVGWSVAWSDRSFALTHNCKQIFVGFTSYIFECQEPTDPISISIHPSFVVTMEVSYLRSII